MINQNMKHFLIIGGTGMLQKVCLNLNNESSFVAMIGRRQSSRNSLAKKCSHPENMNTISVDYHNDDQLKKTLKSSFHKYGYPHLIISWIHSSAPYALDIVIDLMQQSPYTWRLFHVQSSASVFKKENTSVPATCLYRRVYLGFVIENNRSRWLTHDEISEGVIDAIITDRLETTVGTLEPWDKRP